MMFSAGMGIGLMFFGVAEPLTHFTTPPPGTGAAGNPEAVQNAMATTLFHWTLHPWAIYAVVGLAIAYGVYRKGRLQLISAAFEPLLGSRAQRPWGKVIDMLAIFATLFGSAASLGLGALQIRSGLQIVGRHRRDRQHDPDRASSPCSPCLRAVRGLGNRARHPVAVEHQHGAGPGAGVVRIRRRPNGFHPQPDADRDRQLSGDIAMMSARTGAEGADVNTWLQSWTIFYWAWWMSWTPFVGMFIARISRGRTIRQFVAGVLLVPSLVSLVWFAVFGGAAIKVQQEGVDLAGEGSIEAQLFGLLDQYPIATIASVLVMVLVAIFFVSGADAASIVMGSLSERGTIKPGRGTVIFWGVAMGAVAAVMLLVGGEDALKGLQTITIIAALPFVLVMVGLAVALVKDLRNDPKVVRRQYASEAVNSAVVAGVTQHGDDFVISVEKDPAQRPD